MRQEFRQAGDGWEASRERTSFGRQTNTLGIQVKGDNVIFTVNGTEVTRLSKAKLHTDGMYALRGRGSSKPAVIAHDWVNFGAILGAVEQRPDDREKFQRLVLKNRREAEHSVTQRLIGNLSGLPDKVQTDLKMWDAIFNYEVHFGVLSLGQEIMGMTRGSLPPIGPTIDHDDFVMYMNRSAELGWMVVRLLPFLQVSAGEFGAEWMHKRQVLDESFRFMVEALGNLGKSIAGALIQMIDTGFVFKEPFHFFEPTPKNAKA